MAETKTLYIKLLTPLHIGSKEVKISAFEWVQHGTEVYVVNESALSRKLKDEGLLETYLETFTREGSRFRLNDFLNEHQILSPEILKEFALYRVQANGFDGRDFRPFYRDAFQRPVVPGTSIKGAMRTAILYCMLKERRENDPRWFEDQVVSFVKKKLKEFEKLPNWKRQNFKRQLSKKLTEKLLCSFSFDKKRVSFGPNTDIFRVVKVSDSEPLERDNLVLTETRVLSHHEDKRNTVRFSTGRNRSAREIQIFCETIPEGTVLKCTLKIDEQILAWFSRRNRIPSWFQSPGHILEACASMNRDLLAAERQYLDSLAESREVSLNALQDFFYGLEANFCLGFGGGLLNKTIDLLLPDELRKQLRDTLWHPRTSLLAPKSRVIVVNSGQPTCTLGWAQISSSPLYADRRDEAVVSRDKKNASPESESDMKQKLEELKRRWQGK